MALTGSAGRLYVGCADPAAGRKLERDPSAPQIIRTERAVTYVFALAVEAL
jgi:hypothetical protein